MKIARFEHKDDGYTRFIEPEPCKHPDSEFNNDTKYYECDECGHKRLMKFNRTPHIAFPSRCYSL